MFLLGGNAARRAIRNGLGLSLGVVLFAASTLATFASGTAQAGNVPGSGIAKKLIQVEATDGSVTTVTVNALKAGETGIPSNSKLFATNPNKTLATTCSVQVTPATNGTSGNGRAPSTRYRYIRAVYIIPAAELAAAGVLAGAPIATIGWNMDTGSGVAGVAPLKIYLENTADDDNLKSPTWTSAISGMTLVHDAPTALPDLAGDFDVSFSGGSPFTYTGGGLYVAFEENGYAGTLSTTARVSCSTAVPVGLQGAQSQTALPTTIAGSDFRPETRLVSTTQNDISVEYVVAKGALPFGLVAPQEIQAIVTNRGALDQTNIPVTLTISGAEFFTDTKTVPSLLGCGGTATVTFAAWTPTVIGSDVLTASVGSDDVPANNSKSRNLAVTVPSYSYKHPGSTPAGGVGVNGNTATFIGRFPVTGATKLTQVTAEFLTAGQPFRVAVYDEFGDPLYVDAADRTTSIGTVTVTLPSPINITGPEFYAGVQQTGTVNFSLSYDAEDPIRSGDLFGAIPIGSAFFDLAPGNNFRINLGVTLDRCDATAAASNNGPTCSGQTLQLFGSATNGLTYAWTGPNGFTSSQQNPSIPNATTAASGVYHLTVNSCTTDVTTSAVVTAPYTLTASAGAGGSISPSGATSANCFTNKTFTIAPASCFSIADVLVDGVSVGAVSSYTFLNVQANHTIAASFSANGPSTITASAGPGGSISPSGAISVACGGSQTFAIAGDACHTIADVLVDGGSVGAVSSYTFTNVTTNHTISASFALINYTIAASSGPNGSISPSGAVPVGCGAGQTFTFTPSIGYIVKDVLVDGGSVGAVPSYAFSGVSANHTISVTFKIDVTAVIAAQSTSTYICPTNPCVALPVTIARAIGAPVLGFSVTLQLSGNLALCSPSSISEGTFLSSAGPTTFLVIDNGGGSYTVDGAVLGLGCGPTALTGTLFSVGVGSGAANGTGSITITSVSLRDCANGVLPAIAGLVGTVPIDNQSPVVTVISPNGGEVWFPGSTQNIVWSATDNVGVTSVDIDYSLDGGATYPVNVATGIANSGSFAWLVPGPPTTQGRIRVTAREAGCGVGVDASDADFIVRDPVIISSAGPNGSITPNGTTSVSFGGSQSYAIAADPCYSIADVKVDGVSVGAVASYTFSNVSADHTIAATFSLNVYTITASSGAGGSISPAGAVAVNCGTNQPFTITPNTCFAIADVKVDGVSVGAVASYTFLNVQTNHTIAATFVSTTLATTTVLAVSPSPSVCQQPVVLTATVTPNTATGTVEFFDGVTSLGTSPVVSGVATLSPGALSVGAHTLKAVFTPTGCFLASTSPNKAHTVNKAPVTVTVTSSPNPSIWNQPVTFTITVAPASATGSVTLKDSLTTLAVLPLSGGTANFVKSNLYTGNHTAITATYNGDACYLTKTSAKYSQLVYRAVSSVSVGTDINPSLCGQTIKITAIVTPLGATGQARFYDNGNLIGTANFSGSTGLASLTSNNMLPGKHVITVDYVGDTHYIGSSSNSYSQVVNLSPTSLTLVSDLNPAKYGATVHLTATVSPSNASGTIEFFDGATSLGTVAPVGGVSTLTITTQLAAGSHALSAVFSGDACTASASASLQQDITPDSPPQVTVLYPNNHETICIDGDVKLTWTATDNTAITTLKLELSRDNGGTWETIAANAPNTGSYVWHVTAPSTNVGTTQVYSAILRVTATDNAGVMGTDDSDSPFSLFDCVVATVITELDVEAVDLGVQIKWAFATRNAFTTVVLERSPSESGPWVAVAAEMNEVGEATVAVDRSAESGQTYFYRLRGTTAAGNVATFGPVKGTAGAPKEFALSAIWPNPSRGPVAMTFSVPRSAHVSLSVIDLQGRELSSLAEGQFKAGRYQINWDGRSDRGPVPAGLYFVRFITPDKKLVSRIAITH